MYFKSFDWAVKGGKFRDERLRLRGRTRSVEGFRLVGSRACGFESLGAISP